MFPAVIRRWSTTATKPAKFGQPVFASHPHLSPSVLFLCHHILIRSLPVNRDECTPGIPIREYEARRRRLMQTLPDNSLVVLMGGKVKYMSNRKSPTWSYARPASSPHRGQRYCVSRSLTSPNVTIDPTKLQVSSSVRLLVPDWFRRA